MVLFYSPVALGMIVVGLTLLLLLGLNVWVWIKTQTQNQMISQQCGYIKHELKQSPHVQIDLVTQAIAREVVDSQKRMSRFMKITLVTFFISHFLLIVLVILAITTSH